MLAWGGLSLVFLVSVCVGLSDREDWLELNDRGMKTSLPGVKSVSGQAEDKAPAPVARPHVGPHVSPHVGPDVDPDAMVEPRRPNFPILPKPPTKVRPKYYVVFINFSQNQLKNQH